MNASPELNLEKGLSVVIPCYNEASHIMNSVACAVTSLQQSGIPFQILVIDDGSNDSSPMVIGSLNSMPFVQVVQREHRGRIQTRLEGIKHCKFEYVLMLDARVQLDELSIISLKKLCTENPDSNFWNGHLEIANLNLAHVSVWQTLVGIGWSAYVRNPRLCKFGLAEFDSFPKGTGIFLASRSDWKAELEKLALSETKSATALSDDTRLLKEFATRSDIWISPEFKATYIPRTEFSAFTKNLFYRGTTFIDSYWNSKNKIGYVVRLFLPVVFATVIGSILFMSFMPWLIAMLTSLVVLSGLLGVISFQLWGSAGRAVKEFLIGFVFWPLFGFGLARGYLGHFVNGIRLE